jgi:hypothetical protein
VHRVVQPHNVVLGGGGSGRMAVKVVPLERADQCGHFGVKMGGSGALLREMCEI